VANRASRIQGGAPYQLRQAPLFRCCVHQRPRVRRGLLLIRACRELKGVGRKAGPFPLERSMNTVTMKALRDFLYAGKRIKRGQVFQARGSMRAGSDAYILKAIGHAEPYSPPPSPTPAPVVRQSYQTRVMV